MGYTWENDCVGCPQGCINCGRKNDYKQYYCDGCGDPIDADKPRLYIHGKYELCKDCYCDRFISKICDDMDEDKCSECGAEADFLYQKDGRWLCEECLLFDAEEVAFDE